MSSVVSIHDDRNQLAGTGVLFTDELVLTCAHVVNIALGRAVEHPGRPDAGSFVTIRFNGAPIHACEACVHSAPDAWSEPPAQRAAGADLCVLRLTKQKPCGASPARIQPHHFTTDFPARATGYPADWNKAASSPKLDIAECKVLGSEGYLWFVRADDGSRLAAAYRKSRIAGLIYSGFSGGPLEKGEYLVGLIARAREKPDEATAYAIPAVNFPECVWRSAQLVSDPLVALADTEVRSAAAAGALQAADQEIAAASTGADEKRRQAGPALSQEDAAEELISSYSAIFVGRDDEANRIRSLVWSEEPGYLFVKGEGGAGKSALLVHLVQELRTRDARSGGPFVIYHFIRQERGDVLPALRSLNAQVARALGEFASFVAAPNLEEQFKALWSRLMLHSSRERPVLLVVDGLDQLEDPASLGRWLPGYLAPYAHVVASGRTTFDPLRHLPNIHVARSAAPPIALGPLERKDVERLLEQQLKSPAAAARLVDPVFRLTKGFALATRLLAKDIAENGEAALQDEARLAALTRDYLGEEARHLTESAADPLRRRVLAVLSEARGPLTPEDLAGILQPDQGDIERALQPVLRCLASPTSLEFMHLELKRAVAEQLTADEKEAAQGALSRWMQFAVEARGVAAIPAYALDHFVDQFRTADLKALTTTIVSDYWCASRYAQRGSHADYINDLDRIRELAVSSQPDWPVLCEASCVRANLHTVAASMPLAVLLLLADLGGIDEACDYAALQPDLPARAWALTRLSSRYRQRGEGDKAAKALAHAEATLDHIPSAKKRCSVLDVLASSFKEAGDLPSAKRMARYCRDTVSLVDGPYETERAEALEEAIDASATAGDFDEAIQLVQSQANGFAYYHYLERVVVPLAEGSAFDRLLESMSKAQSAWYVEHAIGKAVQRLASAGFVAQAKRLAVLAPGYPYSALINIGESLARKGDIEGCLSTLGQIGLRGKSELIADLTGVRRLLCRWNIAVDWVLRQTPLERYDLMADTGRRNALRRIVLYLPGKVNAAEAPSVARRLIALAAIESPMSGVRVRAEVVGWLAESGAADAALDLAREIRSKAAAFDHLPLKRDASEIASAALGRAGKWDEAYAMLEPLLADGDAGQADKSDRADRTRLRAAEALARCKKYDEALALCDQIQNLGVRACGLAEVAAELAATDAARAKEKASAALDLARRQNAEEDRKVAHQAIAFAFARRGLADEARAAASALAESVQKEALSTVIYLLLEAGNIDGAEATALAIPDWSAQHSQLLRVTRTLLRSQQYERAFATASRIPYEGYRFDALVESMEVVLAKRPPYEHDRWLEKAMAEAKRNVATLGVEFRGRLGRAVLNAGDRDKAKAILADALALARGRPVALGAVHARLAFACIDGHPEDARSIAARRLTGTASTKDAALVLAQLGDWDQVALRIGATSDAARVQLLAAVGETAVRRGGKDKARECLKQLHDCLDGLPDAERPAALTEAARLHLRLGDADRAAELCRRAYDQMAKSGDAAKLETLAEPIARAGQKELALQCLTAASEWMRRLAQANIARALAEAGAHDPAVDLAQATVASEDPDRDYLNKITQERCSQALATAGRPDLALQVALQLGEPTYRVGALIHLAGAHQQAGRATESKDVLLQALAAIPAAEAGSFAVARAEAAAILSGLGHRMRARGELVNAFAHAVAAGADAFVRTVGAGAPVLAAELHDGAVWDLIEGLERSATVLSRQPAGR